MNFLYKLTLVETKKVENSFPQNSRNLKLEELNEYNNEELKSFNLNFRLTSNINKIIDLSNDFNINNIQFLYLKSNNKLQYILKRGELIEFQGNNNFVLIDNYLVTSYIYDINNLLTLELKTILDSEIELYIIGK